METGSLLRCEGNAEDEIAVHGKVLDSHEVQWREMVVVLRDFQLQNESSQTSFSPAMSSMQLVKFRQESMPTSSARLLA